MIAGVAAGLAARTGIDVTVIRIVLLVVALPSGFGVAAYLVAWLLLPADGTDGSIANRALADRRGMTQAAGLGSLAAVGLLLAFTTRAGRRRPPRAPSTRSRSSW